MRYPKVALKSIAWTIFTQSEIVHFSGWSAVRNSQQKEPHEALSHTQARSADPQYLRSLRLVIHGGVLCSRVSVAQIGS